MTIQFDEVAIKASSRDIVGPLTTVTDSKSITIIGGVGAGKTLLARALAGERFEGSGLTLSGTVTLGNDFIDFSRQRIPSIRTGYIPQVSTACFIAPTVASEIASVAYCTAAKETQAHALIQRWQQLSPLSARSKISPFALSGGQQRMLMLETVLASEPDNLVIDGADAAFDLEFRTRSVELISNWLAAAAHRRCIMFSNTEDNAWYPLDHKLLLGLLSAPKNLPHAKYEIGMEILAFNSITAGPKIGERYLLQNVNLVIHVGEFVALKGPNGIGKSTLLRLVAGIQRPRSGDVLFNGVTLGNAHWPGLENGVAFIHQEPELTGAFALEESFRTVQSRLLDENTSGSYFPSWDGTLAGYWTLSSGERALISLLRQIVHGPSILILDELNTRIPSAILNQIVAEQRMRNPRLAGLIVSHDEAFTSAVCDRVVHLSPRGIINQ